MWYKASSLFPVPVEFNWSWNSYNRCRFYIQTERTIWRSFPLSRNSNPTICIFIFTLQQKHNMINWRIPSKREAPKMPPGKVAATKLDRFKIFWENYDNFSFTIQSVQLLCIMSALWFHCTVNLRESSAQLSSAVLSTFILSSAAATVPYCSSISFLRRNHKYEIITWAL